MFDLHWEQEEEAFFDRGLEVSDGHLVQEAIMRCKNGSSGSESDGLGSPCRNGQARALCLLPPAPPFE